MAEPSAHETPPSGTDPIATPPVNDAGAAKSPEADFRAAGRSADQAAGIADAFREQVQQLTQEVQDRARGYAEEGKARTTDVLDEISRVITDAANTVDEKLGEQYGRYARSAAEYVDGLARSLDGKQVDDVLTDVRGLVQKSPAIAIGAAAAAGFALARVVRSGIGADRRDA